MIAKVRPYGQNIDINRVNAKLTIFHTDRKICPFGRNVDIKRVMDKKNIFLKSSQNNVIVLEMVMLSKTIFSK